VLFLALYLSMTITTFFTKKYLDKTDLYKSSIVGMFILLLSALFVIFSRNIYFVLCAMILEGIGAGVWVPSKTALYWGRTKPQSREIVSGYLNGLRTFASTIGPLVGGLLVFYINILAPFYFKAVISLLSIGIYVWLMRTRK
jgi:predicted MFS family arabinose efflux permease